MILQKMTLLLCSKIAYMKKYSTKFDLHSFEAHIQKEAIGEDFVIVDNISEVPFFEYPTKIDSAILSVCLKGHIEGGINLKPYSFSENDLFIILPGQIVQYFHKSQDYSGFIISMSKRFTDNLELNIKDSVSVLLHLQENPIIHLPPDELAHLLEYYSIIRKIILNTSNPNRIEVIRLLVLALFYNFQQIRRESTYAKSKREGVFEAFYGLLLVHYKESREVGFYANKLCLTPKYLSTLIKELTGKSAFDWINDYVTLEAKALLKSTDLTIQQISDKLNFPSQSFFGKYFKRLVGISPKEYRGR